ncbi:MAG: MFS transporter [Oscillospiraceae bacterium]|nr:MFS transporter [Oscillospiraceae bacterium]
MQKKLWNKDFILMLQGNAFSAIGDLLYSVAIGYWVYEQTGSNTLMGVISSISMFMVMFLSPFSGSIVDKCSRKAVIVGMDAARGVIMLGIGALAFAGELSVAWVLVAAFLASLCAVFFSPAASTLLLDLIPHDEMVRGQSVQSGVSAFLNMVGKAVSGALVAFLGVPLILVLNGVSYLISAFTELFIRVPKTIQQGQPVTVRGVLADFSLAARRIFSDRFLSLFIPSALILNLLSAGPLALMMPFVLEKGFTVDMYGYLMSVETAASLVCVCLLGAIKLKPTMRYYCLSLGFISSIPLYILAYLATDFTVMCVLFFLGCFANMLGNTVFNASLMLALPEENRGAILGLVSAVSTGGCALSAVVFGALGDLFPLYLVFIVGNLLSIVPMVYLCLHRKTKEFITTH